MKPQVQNAFGKKRRLAIVDAKNAITVAMEGHELTPLEWVSVFQESIQWIVREGLKEEWTDDFCCRCGDMASEHNEATGHAPVPFPS
jgi:hypothetical protein